MVDDARGTGEEIQGKGSGEMPDRASCPRIDGTIGDDALASRKSSKLLRVVVFWRNLARPMSPCATAAHTKRVGSVPFAHGEAQTRGPAARFSGDQS